MKYHVTYEVTPQAVPIGKEEVPEGKGACTAVLLASLLYPEDGSYSVVFLTVDGRTGGPLEDSEIWKAWLMLAHRLSESKTLPEGKRDLCKQAFEVVQDAIRARTS